MNSEQAEPTATRSVVYLGGSVTIQKNDRYIGLILYLSARRHYNRPAQIHSATLPRGVNRKAAPRKKTESGFLLFAAVSDIIYPDKAFYVLSFISATDSRSTIFLLSCTELICIPILS